MKEMTVEAIPKNILPVTEFVNTQLQQLGCSRRVQGQIDIAVDELFANIAHYAYEPGTGPATVRVEVEDGDTPTVIITFLDRGKPFNPLERQDPNVKLPARERALGGLGIFIVKKSMDSVTYEYKDGKNILRIRKKL